jgi:cell division septum initiation protein DivIVA
MLYAIVIVICIGLIAAALFFFIRSNELSSQLRAAAEAWQLKEDGYTSELAKLEKIRHIPDVIEKAKRAKADGEAKLADAEKKADEILQLALVEAQDRSKKLRAEAETLKVEAQETLRVAKAHSQKTFEEAQNEARELASKARKDAKDKREQTEAALFQAMNDWSIRPSPSSGNSSRKRAARKMPGSNFSWTS